MKGIVNISEAASLAFHAMAVLSSGEDGRFTSAGIAKTISSSEAHLSKVMRRLVLAGLVDSIRGPGGGFTLARAPGEIRLLEIYEAVEGPLRAAECLMDDPCCRSSECIMADLVTSINLEAREYLRSRNLSEYSDSCRLGRASGEEG